MSRPTVEWRLRLFVDTLRHALGCEHHLYQEGVRALITGRDHDYSTVARLFARMTAKEKAAFVEECEYRLSHVENFIEPEESKYGLISAMGKLHDLAAHIGILPRATRLRRFLLRPPDADARV